MKSTDPISEVCYTYASCGKPSRISSNGSVTTIEYDDVANQTVLNDPDAGRITYTYAADGKVLTETDARGIKTENTYDNSGLLRSSKVGEKLITNFYGKYGIDYRIVKSINGNKSVEYAYDKYGRVTTEKRTVGGHGTYSFAYTYNDKNQLSQTTYPGGLVVAYQYDENGFKVQTKAGDNVIYKFESEDGLVSSSSFMGKLTAEYTRDSRGWESCIKLKRGTDVLERFDENYDTSNGNMLSRQRKGFECETFGYDDLDRLVSVKRGAVETMRIEYANDGNIQFKTGVGNYGYESAIHPHAVTSVDNSDNIIPSSRLNTVFNDINKIQLIEEAGKNMRMDFEYGPDYERWYSELLQNGKQVRVTVYVGDYEKITENGTTREFYYLDGNAIVIKQNGAFKNYIAFTDNIGNILCVIDENGSKVFDASYDAWGKQTIRQNSIGLHRGYTGHEMLPEFGIINMNGRLYDPVIGRFLSPDNYVQSPYNSQNFNRYSYCLNNPLKYTDPSGELITQLFVIGAMAYMGGAMANINPNNNPIDCTTWNWKSLSTYSGIVSGAMSAAGAYGYTYTLLPSVDGIITRGGMMAGINVAANGIGNCLQGNNFFKNWYVAALRGFVEGAFEGYQMVAEKNRSIEIGEKDNFWWGNRVKYNRNEWSFINTDKPDYEVIFDKIKNVGSLNSNDCVPTTFAELEAALGGKRSYADFLISTKYIQDKGVEISLFDYQKSLQHAFGNKFEKLDSKDLWKLFDPKFMEQAAKNGQIFSCFFYTHADNVRSLRVFTRASYLNELTFRQSRYNTNCNGTFVVYRF